MKKMRNEAVQHKLTVNGIINSIKMLKNDFKMHMYHGKTERKCGKKRILMGKLCVEVKSKRDLRLKLWKMIQEIHEKIVDV